MKAHLDMEPIARGARRRSIETFDAPCARSLKRGGKTLLDLSSNDYLGLRGHPEVAGAMIEATRVFGAGSGGSRLVTGAFAPHAELEARIRSFKGREAVLLFNSGYQANTGAISAIAGRGWDIFIDRLAHASLIDGAILSRARIRRYPHLDTATLEEQLAASRARGRLIVTEGLFSMDGTAPDMAAMARLAMRYDALLYIDDAHAFGVMGPSGRGSLEGVAFDPSRVIEMATLGKAVGVYGAFVAASAPIIELLVNRARAFIYSTSLPPAVCSAALKGLEIMEREPQRRARLMERAGRLKSVLSKAVGGAGRMAPAETHAFSPIVPFITGGDEPAIALSKGLEDCGYLVRAIRPPTVPEGASRLRFTASSELEEVQIDSLGAALSEALRGL